MKQLNKVAMEVYISEGQKECLEELRKELGKVLLLEGVTWKHKTKVKWQKEIKKTFLFNKLVNRSRRKSLTKELEIYDGVVKRR